MRYQPGGKIFERFAACPVVAQHVRSKRRLRGCDLEVCFTYTSGLVGDFFHSFWRVSVVWRLFNQERSPLVKRSAAQQ